MTLWKLTGWQALRKTSGENYFAIKHFNWVFSLPSISFPVALQFQLMIIDNWLLTLHTDQMFFLCCSLRLFPPLSHEWNKLFLQWRVYSVEFVSVVSYHGFAASLAQEHTNVSWQVPSFPLSHWTTWISMFCWCSFRSLFFNPHPSKTFYDFATACRR